MPRTEVSGFTSAHILSLINSLTSDLDSKIPASDMAIPLGVATLDANGKIFSSQLLSKVVVVGDLQYGTVDTSGVANSYVAIAAALAAVPKGGKLIFPPGKYKISQSLIGTAERRITSYKANRYQKYNPDGAGNDAVYLRPADTFTGPALIRGTDCWGLTIDNINLQGYSVGSSVCGILAEGTCKGWYLDNISVRNFSGDGIRTDAITSGYPNGWYVKNVNCFGNSGWGWNSQNTVGVGARKYPFGDSRIVDSEFSVNGLGGINFLGGNNMSVNGCKSEFNRGPGYSVVGPIVNFNFNYCTTDRNDFDGFDFNSDEQTGSAAENFIKLVGCTTNRDGANSVGQTVDTQNPPGGTGPYQGGYAGIHIHSTSTHCPVVISGHANRVGRNDDGGGQMSPDYGILAVNARSIVVGSSQFAATYKAASDDSMAIQFDESTKWDTVDFTSYSVTRNVTGPISSWRASKYKTADLGRTSTTTLTTDPDLTLSFALNAVYMLEGFLIYDAPVATDMKLQFSNPTSTSLVWGITGLASTTTAAIGSPDLSALNITATAVLGGAGVGTLVVATIRGLFTTGSSSGFLGFKWAPNASDAVAVTLRAGTYLRINRLS